MTVGYEARDEIAYISFNRPEKHNALRDEDQIVMGGAVGDPPHTAMIVFRDAAAAQAFVAVDPYVAAGLVVRWTVEPWNVVT